VTIEKGKRWGLPGGLPDDGVVVRSDAEARGVVEAARRAGSPLPPLGLLGGDLCRTLGGTGDEGRLRSGEGVRFPVDLGEAVIDGQPFLFVAHVVARNRTWTRGFLAMNAEFLGAWDVAPRAHPNDGLLDTLHVRLAFRDLPAVRARLPAGAHLPHPGVRERRAPAAEVDLGRILTVWVDGERVGKASALSVRVEPDALTVVV
jgi:hypothetical protein